jgi:hypothetical protein
VYIASHVHEKIRKAGSTRHSNPQWERAAEGAHEAAGTRGMEIPERQRQPNNEVSNAKGLLKGD